MTSEERPEFSKAARLMWSCRLVAVTWSLFAIFGLLVIGVAMGMVSRGVVGAAWWTFASVGVLVMAVETTFRCDHCKRRFMVEGFGGKHPAARRRGRMNYWSSAVIDILRDHVFTCMYCGHQFRVSSS